MLLLGATGLLIVIFKPGAISWIRIAMTVAVSMALLAVGTLLHPQARLKSAAYFVGVACGFFSGVLMVHFGFRVVQSTIDPESGRALDQAWKLIASGVIYGAFYCVARRLRGSLEHR